jgi:HSP20 family molecular chaperone IbpA
MWADAVQMLAQAERLHRQLFEPRGRRPTSACWEPPVDMLETEREVLVLAALPGVDPEAVKAAIEEGALVLSGSRILPAELERATIHRLELPQGCFERRIPLPAGRYDGVSRTTTNGCLLVRLHKAR